MFYFDFMLMLVTAPAILLMMWAQYRLRSTYSAGMQIGTSLSGAAAAAHLLESASYQSMPLQRLMPAAARVLLLAH